MTSTLVRDTHAPAPVAAAPTTPSTRLGARLARQLRIVGDIRRAGREVYGIPWAPMLFRAIQMRRKGGHALKNSLSSGFLDTRVPLHPGWISKDHLIALQDRLFPQVMEEHIEDKALLADLLEADGIATPITLAVLIDDDIDRSGCRQLLFPASEWAEALEHLDGEIIIKPVRGACGRGVQALERTPDGWRSPDGTVRSAREVANDLRRSADARSWTVQRRVHNHGGMALGDGRTLNTLRIITLVGIDGEARIEHTHLRIAAPGSVVDNISGHDGNLSGLVDQHTGVIQEFTAQPSHGVGFERSSREPVSGATAGEYTLPCWDEVRALSLRTARALLPARCLGLDVAITPDGPCIIEVNLGWDPMAEADLSGTIAGMRDLADALEREMPVYTS